MDRFRWDPDPDLGATAIPAHVITAVPADLAREENVLPMAISGGALTVAVDRPADFGLIDKLQFILGACGLRIEPVAAPTSAIRAAAARYYGEATA